MSFAAIQLAKLAIVFEQAHAVYFPSSAHDMAAIASAVLLESGVEYFLSIHGDSITCTKCRKASRNPNEHRKALLRLLSRLPRGPALNYNDLLRVRAVFSDNNWLAMALLPAPFINGGECHHRGPDRGGCPNPATSRILVNIWGTVVEYETCDEHASYHGKLLDDFPVRRALHEDRP